MVAFLGRSALPVAKAGEAPAATAKQRQEALAALDEVLEGWIKSLKVRHESVTLLSEKQYAGVRAAEVAAAKAGATPLPPPPPPFDSIQMQPLGPGGDCRLMWSIAPEVPRRQGFVFDIEVDGERVATAVARNTTQPWFAFPEGRAPCSTGGTHKVTVVARDEKGSEPFARAEISLVGERQPPSLAGVTLLEGAKGAHWILVSTPREWEPDVALQVQVDSAPWTDALLVSEAAPTAVFMFPRTFKADPRKAGRVQLRSALGSKTGPPVEARWLAPSTKPAAGTGRSSDAKPTAPESNRVN